MKSAWNEREANATVERYAAQGVAPELALRVYSTRLLGRDPKLVLHGGGNTSLKTMARDVAGAEVEVLYVKGSGSDMGVIEPSGFPAVRLDPLRALRTLERLSLDDMARVQRGFMVDPLAPAPSVEMLLHAFMPAKCVDHTHPTAVLSLPRSLTRQQAQCHAVAAWRAAYVGQAGTRSRDDPSRMPWQNVPLR